MPRVKITPASPDRESIDVEIARLRNLDVASLQSRWHTVLGRRPPPHLSRHLLFRILAYRLQADRLGDIDSASRALLDRSGSPEEAGRSAVDPRRPAATVRPGTVLGREWNGHMHRVAVLRSRANSLDQAIKCSASVSVTAKFSSKVPRSAAGSIRSCKGSFSSLGHSAIQSSACCRAVSLISSTARGKVSLALTKIKVRRAAAAAMAAATRRTVEKPDAKLNCASLSIVSWAAAGV
jgi:Protein of unknown function (DUF2924)